MQFNTVIFYSTHTPGFSKFELVVFDAVQNIHNVEQLLRVFKQL